MKRMLYTVGHYVYVAEIGKEGTDQELVRPAVEWTIQNEIDAEAWAAENGWNVVDEEITFAGNIIKWVERA